MIEIRQTAEDSDQMRVWSVQPTDFPKVLQGLKHLPIETLLGEPEVVTIAEKVAWRYAHMKVAAFFNVGDEILYGKYKNKRGRIIQFGLNDKGQPLVEIEPVPKGRKKNKMMGLFKIWNVAAIAKALNKEAMDPITERVAGRFIVKAGIPLGKSWETGSIRIHRWRDMYTITELTNAGKRGKQVREMSVDPRVPDVQGWMERMSEALPEYTTYDQVLAFFKDLAKDYPGQIQIHESVKRGVDVNPGGTTKINLKTDTGLEITAEPMYFSIKKTDVFQGRAGPFNQDTLYGSRDKKGASVFYNWLKANLSEANRMDIQGFQKLWKDLQISWDSH